MPYCTDCGFSYKLGIDECPKCGADLPKLQPYKKEKIISGSEIEYKKNLTSIPAAPIAKRISAGVVDFIIGIGLMIFIIRIVIFQYIFRRALIKGFITFIIIYALSALYFLLRDSLKGKSIGKLIFALTAINLERKRPADLADSILRNSILAILIVPVIGWITFVIFAAIITIQISLGKEQRIGDRFAHTKVIEDKYLESILIQE